MAAEREERVVELVGLGPGGWMMWSVVGVVDQAELGIAGQAESAERAGQELGSWA